MRLLEMHGARNYENFGGSDRLDDDGPPAEPPHRAVQSASAGGWG
jgi:hypothetical protein